LQATSGLYALLESRQEALHNVGSNKKTQQEEPYNLSRKETLRHEQVRFRNGCAKEGRNCRIELRQRRHKRKILPRGSAREKRRGRHCQEVGKNVSTLTTRRVGVPAARRFTLAILDKKEQSVKATLSNIRLLLMTKS
jgi:hypothetical protein